MQPDLLQFEFTLPAPVTKLPLTSPVRAHLFTQLSTVFNFFILDGCPARRRHHDGFIRQVNGGIRVLERANIIISAVKFTVTGKIQVNVASLLVAQNRYVVQELWVQESRSLLGGNFSSFFTGKTLNDNM